MIKRLWHTNRLALIAFGIALCVLGFFGFKTITSTMYWMDPAHQNQPLAGWMTPRYVSMSYKLPPEIVGPMLFSVKGEGPKRQSLDTIAAQNGVTIQDLQDRIDEAAEQFHAEREEKRDE